MLKTPQEIEIMAEGGRRLGEILQRLENEVAPGVTTKHLDQLSYKLIHKAGAKPAFLNYRPSGATKAYPYTLCTSVNDGIVHGQPSGYVLKQGDLIKLDLGLKYKGFYLDAARTVPVGNPTREVKKLIMATREALAAGIKEARTGKTLGDIGHAIEKIVKKNKFSVTEGLTGHGIGRALHEDPTVFNFGKSGVGEELQEGMVLAIEPMVATGKGKIRQIRDESYATADGSFAAHFEHTVAITKNGPRILTT